MCEEKCASVNVIASCENVTKPFKRLHPWEALHLYPFDNSSFPFDDKTIFSIWNVFPGLGILIKLELLKIKTSFSSRLDQKMHISEYSKFRDLKIEDFHRVRWRNIKELLLKKNLPDTGVHRFRSTRQTRGIYRCPVGNWTWRIVCRMIFDPDPDTNEAVSSREYNSGEFMGVEMAEGYLKSRYVTEKRPTKFSKANLPADPLLSFPSLPLFPYILSLVIELLILTNLDFDLDFEDGNGIGIWYFKLYLEHNSNTALSIYWLILPFLHFIFHKLWILINLDFNLESRMEMELECNILIWNCV